MYLVICLTTYLFIGGNVTQDGIRKIPQRNSALNCIQGVKMEPLLYM